jgi:hypothetical protein
MATSIRMRCRNSDIRNAGQVKAESRKFEVGSSKSGTTARRLCFRLELCQTAGPRIFPNARFSFHPTYSTIAKTWFDLEALRVVLPVSCLMLRVRSERTVPKQNLRTATESSLQRTQSV